MTEKRKGLENKIIEAVQKYYNYLKEQEHYNSPAALRTVENLIIHNIS